MEFRYRPKPPPCLYLYVSLSPGARGRNTSVLLRARTLPSTLRGIWGSDMTWMQSLKDSAMGYITGTCARRDICKRKGYNAHVLNGSAALRETHLVPVAKTGLIWGS